MFLFVNTSLSIHEIIIFTSNKILFERKFKGGKESEVPFYETFLEIKQKFDLNTLDGIITLTGPGHFTALRLGICTVNTLAFILDKKIIGISTQEFIKIGEDDLPILLPGGGNYAHLFLNENHEVVDIFSLDKTQIYLGEVDDKYKEGINFRKNTDILSKLQFIINSQNEFKTQIFPWYGKSPI